MLDDLKYIHQRDHHDALGVAEKQWQQLLYDFELQPFSADVENIVLSGMGGSALGAMLSTTWPGYKVPFVISRDYAIQKYVSPKTLFVAMSYSGNTEETLSSLLQAQKSGAQIAVIAAGGNLAAIAEEKRYPFARLPGGLQPRYAALYGFKAIIDILQAAGSTEPGLDRELTAAADHIKHSVAGWLPTVPEKNNLAKRLALELVGKSPVIYSSAAMFPAAYKWKISINENAKNVAWCNQLPEFNHNEMLGWSSHPIDKPYAVVDLRSSFDHERIQKRFEATERMLSGKRPAPEVVHAAGNSPLEHMLYFVALGDFVSIYMALLNNIDPTPVTLIEKFKKVLND